MTPGGINGPAPAGPDDASLEERIARLEARAEIAELMQRYAAAADRKYTAGRTKQSPAVVRAAARVQAACFTQDAEWHGGRFGGTLHGRAAIEDFFAVSPWLFTAHHYGSPSFTFHEDEADVRWRLLEVGIREGDGQVVLLTGSVRQTCRRTEEGWRIARMAFDTLHAIRLADEPERLRCLIPLGEPM